MKAVWIPCLLLLSACGPMIAVESGEDDSGPATDGPSATTAMTTDSPPIVTSGPTTAPPATSDGPLDTGEFDTGEPWLDLPQDCSILEQDCPPGAKCMPWSGKNGGGGWYDTKCVPIADDPNADGEPCSVVGDATSGLDDCDGTTMCWNVDPETNMGTCVPFCIGDESNPTCADRCDYCAIASDGPIALCLDRCDPITQNCGPGQACYPVNDVFTCAPDASPADAGIGTPCEFINVCPPGLACLTADAVPECEGSIGCCAPYCPVGGADPCPGLLPGSECTPWYEEGGAPPEACVVAEPGVCVLPQ